jgi:hypothetical protein
VVVRGDGLECRARHAVAEFPDYEPILAAERRARVVVAERAALLARPVRGWTDGAPQPSRAA